MLDDMATYVPLHFLLATTNGIAVAPLDNLPRHLSAFENESHNTTPFSMPYKRPTTTTLICIFAAWRLRDTSLRVLAHSW